MATGTEGPDVLSNDQSLSNDTINALGGDDVITVSNRAVSSQNFRLVSVDGGAGFDTLIVEENFYIYFLSSASFVLMDGFLGPSVGTLLNPIFASYAGIERLVVDAVAYSRTGEGTSWSTGDTIDEIHVRGTRLGAFMTLTTGGGDDLVYLGNVGNGSVVRAGSGNDFVEITAAAGAIRNAFGDEGDDLLIGGASDDRLEGGAGGDQLRSGAGTDALLGGDGDDVLYFGAAFTAADVADGGADRDAVVLQGNYTLAFGAAQLIGLESISLQSGANDKFGDTAGNFYDYAVATADGNVAAGQQMIINGQSLLAGENLTFDGSAELDGRFLVFGGHGTDILKGGAGGDIFVFDGDRWGAGDRVEGGGGSDAVVITAGNGLTHIDFGAASLAGVESLSVANRYAGDPDAIPSYEFVLDNGNVAPGATLIVNASSLTAAQVMKLDGRGVHDGRLILFGGGGHDTLTGGDGDDLIVGAVRSDALTGGLGADIFRYDSASDSTASTPDLIGDFQTGPDRIDLSRIDADSGAAGDQAFGWIGSNAFSGAAGELRIFADNGFQRIEGDTDGNGIADLVIVLQIGAAPLGPGDFLL